MTVPGRARLHALPKIDLHLHLDGALRVSTVRDLAREQGVPLPSDDLAELARHVHVQPGCRSLMDFLKVLDFYLPLLRTAGAVERVAYELCEDAARDHLVYFEARFAPHLLAGDGFTPRAAVEAACRGLAQGRRAFGIDARVLLCCCRHLPQHSDEVARLADACRDLGVVGIDLACDERQPAAAHRAAFAFARRRAIHRTVHAGEAGPPANIAEAVDLLHAERIGHAVTLQHDRALHDRVRDAGIHLEINLTSNVQTCSVSDYAAHPFPRYFRDGQRVSLNTDDPGVSNITLTDEYAVAAREYGLQEGDFRALLDHAVDAAFLDDGERRALRARLAARWPAA